MDRATDLGRDELPRTFNQAVNVLAMTENRLIEQHTRSQSRFNNVSGGTRGIGEATFTQVTRGSGRGTGADRGSGEYGR